MTVASTLRRGFALALASAAAPCLLPALASATDPTVVPGETRLVNKITGPGPLNYTDIRWDVYGQDLGSMFEWQGRIYMAFGDTFGRPNEGDVEGGVQHSDPQRLAGWRSNTMAYFPADTTDPHVGPRFEGYLTDPGQGAPLVEEGVLQAPTARPSTVSARRR